VFLNKNTRNARLVGALSVVFPNAQFVHVVRAPLDTISSLLEVAWWKDLNLWTHGGDTPRHLAGTREQETELAAELWCAETGAARAAGQEIPGRYIEIRYESLLADPLGVTKRLLDAVHLRSSAGFEAALARVSVRPRVGTFRQRLSVREQQVAWARVGETAHEFDYARDDT
jgi:hypothetical protein